MFDAVAEGGDDEPVEERSALGFFTPDGYEVEQGFVDGQRDLVFCLERQGFAQLRQRHFREACFAEDHASAGIHHVDVFFG